MNSISVLIIDDEISVLKAVSTILKHEKIDVTCAQSSQEALEALSMQSFDIILLDIMMPQMNGLDVLEKLKEINSDQKVIMMTAYSTLDKVLKSHKIGATNYVMKPFSSLDALEKKVVEVLED